MVAIVYAGACFSGGGGGGGDTAVVIVVLILIVAVVSDVVSGGGGGVEVYGGATPACYECSLSFWPTPCRLSVACLLYLSFVPVPFWALCRTS